MKKVRILMLFGLLISAYAFAEAPPPIGKDVEVSSVIQQSCDNYVLQFEVVSYEQVVYLNNFSEVTFIELNSRKKSNIIRFRCLDPVDVGRNFLSSTISKSKFTSNKDCFIRYLRC